MKNCRNCLHAAWGRTSTGRKKYGNYAECTAVRLVNFDSLPKSISEHWLNARIFNRPYSVVSNDNIEVDCKIWIAEVEK